MSDSSDGNYFDLAELKCVKGLLENLQSHKDDPVSFEIAVIDSNGDALGRIAQHPPDREYVLYLPEAK